MPGEVKAVLTRLSLLCGRTMVFSRLLRTIFHRSFRILFNTVFSQTSAKILRLDTNKHSM